MLHFFIEGQSSILIQKILLVIIFFDMENTWTREYTWQKCLFQHVKKLNYMCTVSTLQEFVNSPGQFPYYCGDQKEQCSYKVWPIDTYFYLLIHTESDGDNLGPFLYSNCTSLPPPSSLWVVHGISSEASLEAHMLLTYFKKRLFFIFFILFFTNISYCCCSVHDILCHARCSYWLVDFTAC